MARQDAEDRPAQVEAEEPRQPRPGNPADQLSQQIGTFFENVEKYQLCEVDDDVRQWARRSQSSPASDGADDSDDEREDPHERMARKPMGPLSEQADTGPPLPDDHQKPEAQAGVPTIDVDQLMQEAQRNDQQFLSNRGPFEMLGQQTASPSKYDTERKNGQITDKLELGKSKANYLDQSFSSSFFVRSQGSEKSFLKNELQ